MTALRKQKMSADEFLAWSSSQPEKWELYDGVPMAMSPERILHGDTKYRVARAFDAAIAAASVPCRFVLDSAAVPIDVANSYQPDLLAYCGERLADDAVSVPNPVIVVEVLSPGNALRDLRDKLQGYFKVPSIQHYLIVDPDKRIVIHHSRSQGGAVITRIVNEGHITLDPPGLSIEVADLFVARPGN